MTEIDAGPAAEAQRHHRRSRYAMLLWAVLAVLNTAVWFKAADGRGRDSSILLMFLGLSLVQCVITIYATVEAIRSKRRGGPGVLLIIGGIFSLLLTGFCGLGGLVLLALGSGGGAWGRPLRVRGRQLHPELRDGADWTRGVEPDASGLDPDSRAALAALWLHDAQKEHASVPAFARISWMLAAVGAPPELHRGAQQAALEEIEHTERCFALAAGYGGRRHTVEPMPELLLDGMGPVSDALSTLVYESVTDGCQLEDFNADVAARCAAVCEEPVTRAVLQQIAREERSHAEFSWRLVEWVVQVDVARAAPAIERGLKDLASYPRPTAVSGAKRALVERANPAVLRRHGRLPDAEWAAAWTERLEKTRQRFVVLLVPRRAAA